MSKQSIKRRRKLPFKSDDGQDINFGFIVLVIATGISISAVLYTIFMRYHVNSPIHDKANEVGEYDIRKYQDIIARAEYYSRTYQNLSKLSVVDFYHSLRGHRFPKAAEMTVSNANQIEIPSIESSFKTNTGKFPNYMLSQAHKISMNISSDSFCKTLSCLIIIFKDRLL